jgi:hypothetical protein
MIGALDLNQPFVYTADQTIANKCEHQTFAEGAVGYWSDARVSIGPLRLLRGQKTKVARIGQFVD